MTSNWQVKKLKDVIKLEYGKPLDKTKREIEGLYPVYGANGEKARSNEYYFDKKSIIVGMKGSAGEINVTTEKFWPLDVTYFVTFDERQYDLKFLFYLLNTLNLPRLAKGVKPGINRNDVYSLDVLTPPLPEQKRIVKILDEAFAAIDKANANAEKNLQNSRELFDSYLNKVFANPGEDWEERKLGEVCEELLAGGDVPKNNFSKYKTERFNIPIFSNGMKNKGLYGYTDIKKVTKPSITISARGTIGYSEIREENFYPVVRLIVLIPKREIISLSFLHYVVSSTDFSNSGTSIPQLTVPMVKKYTIPLPPIPEQKQIVEKLDGISSESKKLETIYQQKLTDLEELKKSILQKAFEGELTIENG